MNTKIENFNLKKGTEKHNISAATMQQEQTKIEEQENRIQTKIEELEGTKNPLLAPILRFHTLENATSIFCLMEGYKANNSSTEAPDQILIKYNTETNKIYLNAPIFSKARRRDGKLHKYGVDKYNRAVWWFCNQHTPLNLPTNKKHTKLNSIKQYTKEEIAIITSIENKIEEQKKELEEIPDGIPNKYRAAITEGIKANIKTLENKRKRKITEYNKTHGIKRTKSKSFGQADFVQFLFGHNGQEIDKIQADLDKI